MKQLLAPGKHLQELDGLRGIAVGLVLLVHFCPNTGAFQTTARVAEVGWIGVDLFFVLSGFLITGILLSNIESPTYYRRFYVRRAFRIFPLYYAFLAAVFLFLALWQSGANLQRLNRDWGSPWWFVVYLANYVTAARGLPLFAALGPLWSLQIEEQFYCVFPFVVRHLRERLLYFLVTVIVLALAYRLLMFALWPENASLQYVGTIARSDALAFGALVSWIRTFVLDADENRWLRFSPALLLPLAVMYALIGPAPSGAVARTLGYSANAVCFAALVWWGAANQDKTCTKFLRTRLLRWLGKISYGAYILQLPVQTALKLVMHIPTGNMVRTPAQSLISTTATLLLAWLSWRFFETPVMRWGHRRFSRQDFQPAPVAVRPS